MTSSPLYLSFGMPKSGSTLAFELTRTMLEFAGVPQSPLASEFVDPSTSNVNFAPKLGGPALKSLVREVRSLERPLVVKLHSALLPKVRESLVAGKLIGQAVCRDPRDVALSMLDAAREGRAWGRGPDGVFRTVADTEKRLRQMIRVFTQWAETPNVMVVHYERLAFDTHSVAAEIATQLGIVADIPKVVDTVKREKFTQLNQGISQRWKSQMAPVDARRLEREFQPFIEKYCADIPGVSAPPGFRAGLVSGLVRRLRPG